MIVNARLRRLERVAQDEYGAYEEQAWRSGNVPPKMLAARLAEIFREAEACRAAGDTGNEVVGRAERLAELFEVARKRRDCQAEATAARNWKTPGAGMMGRSPGYVRIVGAGSEQEALRRAYF